MINTIIRRLTHTFSSVWAICERSLRGLARRRKRPDFERVSAPVTEETSLPEPAAVLEPTPTIFEETPLPEPATELESPPDTNGEGVSDQQEPGKESTDTPVRNRVARKEAVTPRKRSSGVRVPKVKALEENTKTDGSSKPSARKPRKKAEEELQTAAQLLSTVNFLEDDRQVEKQKPAKRSKKEKSKIGEYLERALMDATFFPPAKKWPVLDLCLYGADLEQSEEEEEVNYVQMFPADKWITDLARPLNFHVLQSPGSLDWNSAYAHGLTQQPKAAMRGMAVRLIPWEKAEIGPKRKHNQKYAHPHILPITFDSLEVFNMRVFGDPNYYRKHGTFSMKFAVSKHSAYALADSGVLLDLDRADSEKESSHQDVVRYRIRLCCGMQLAAESTWRVVLSYEGSRPRVAFMASAEIVKELLSLRKCSDKVKKQRMIHIVSSHTRRVREEHTVDVMRHYRGSTETLWKGCNMQIVPPIQETDLMEKMTNKIKSVRSLTDTIQPPVAEVIES
jgi:hypothetical protein